MTITQYNTTDSGGSDVQRAFPISPDRWKKLSSSTSLEPATVDKLKSGWLPSADYYLQQRTKYPWRYVMTGNARLLEFTETQGNQEHFYVAPWSFGKNQSAAMRGIPETAVLWFNDRQGNRHRIYLPFFNQDRVAGEPDLTPVWQAFETMFPGRTPEDNDYLPAEQDMAAVDIHISDDLKTCTATLVRGNQRIPLPLGHMEFFDLQPFAHSPGQATPMSNQIKRLQNGPDL